MQAFPYHPEVRSPEFAEESLTWNVGIVYIGRFVEKLGLDKMLEKQITIERGDDARYSIADTALMLALGVLVGAKRLSHLCQSFLKFNQILS